MEQTNLNLIPQTELPIVHASQYDKNRVIRFMLFEGEEEYTLSGTETAVCNIRKVDNHLVTITLTVSANKYIDVHLTEQANACFGFNFGEIVITSGDTVIGTCNFILDVEKSPLTGGLTSASDIDNLESQIQTIVVQVLGEDYYTKEQVDAIIESIPTFDPENYYDKSDVDGLLADKADAADVYTKTETDNLLADKADISDLPDMSDYYTKDEADTLLLDKADKSDVYTKAQTDSLLFFKADKINDTSASGLPADIVTLTNAGNDCPLSELTVAVASGSSSATIVSCGVNVWDEEWELGEYNTSTGEPAPANNCIRSKSTNYIPVTPSTTFSIVAGGNLMVIFFYDKDFNYISYTQKTYTFDTPSNCRYIRFRMSSSYGVTYNNDIAVLFPSTQTNYAHYNGQKKTISFGTTLTQAGTLDVISGLLTLEDESTIQCTGVEIDTKTGLNNIFCDTGNILTLKYFGSNAEDLFRYIRLIKG